METWEIPEDEDDEDSEDFEEETLSENIIEDDSTTFVRRQDQEEVNTLLDTQPIANLEQDLEDIPTQTEEELISGGADYAAAAGDYADAVADYEEVGVGYEGGGAGYEAITDDSGELTGARMTTARNLSELPRTTLGFERNINMNRFRSQTMQGYPGGEKHSRRDEQYSPGAARHQTDTTGIPPSRGLRGRRK